jgi:hypothetical protein
VEAVVVVVVVVVLVSMVVMIMPLSSLLRKGLQQERQPQPRRR